MSTQSNATDDEYVRLYSLATKIGRAKSLSEQEAEDVAQDVLLALWLRCLSTPLPPIRDRVRWVAQSVRYDAIRILKSRKKQVPLSEVRCPSPAPEDWKIDLVIALTHLSTYDRELFYLRYVRQMTVPRIAGILASSESTTRRRLRRLRCVLTQALAAFALFLPCVHLVSITTC